MRAEKSFMLAMATVTVIFVLNIPTCNALPGMEEVNGKLTCLDGKRR